MSMVTEYAYLNARVSALAARLLPESRFHDLLNQELGRQRTGVSELDDLLNDPNVDPVFIEHAWFMHIVDDFKVLSRPLKGAAHDLLMYWFHKCEVNNVKIIVRGKLGGLETNAIAAQLIDLGALATLNTDRLLRSEDVNELLRQLENTPYSTIARQSRRMFEQHQNLHSLDAAIDRHYLLGFEARVNALNSTQRKYMQPLASIMMDRFNLLWLLRYRLAYGLSPAETYYLLVPTSYKINRALLRQLVEFDKLEQVINALPEPYHTLLANVDSTFEVEYRLSAELLRVANYTLRWHSFTLAKAFAYVLLREVEMRRVLAIAKGKRLKLDDTAIFKAANPIDTISTTTLMT